MNKLSMRKFSEEEEKKFIERTANYMQQPGKIMDPKHLRSQLLRNMDVSANPASLRSFENYMDIRQRLSQEVVMNSNLMKRPKSVTLKQTEVTTMRLKNFRIKERKPEDLKLPPNPYLKKNFKSVQRKKYAERAEYREFLLIKEPEQMREFQDMGGMVSLVCLTIYSIATMITPLIQMRLSKDSSCCSESFIKVLKS